MFAEVPWQVFSETPIGNVEWRQIDGVFELRTPDRKTHKFNKRFMEDLVGILMQNCVSCKQGLLEYVILDKLPNCVVECSNCKAQHRLVGKDLCLID